MRHYIILYVATLLALAPLDALWLTVVANSFYAREMGDLLTDSPNMKAAVAFYLIYVVGLVIFAIAPAAASDGGGWMKAALMGGLFGFFAYMTYDLTNLATLKGFPLSVVIVDVAWGTFVSATVSAAGLLLATWIERFV